MILEKLKEAINEVLDIDVNDISEDSRMVDDLGADSLDMMEIIMLLEEEFNIEIPVEAASGIKTVGQAVEEIEKAINN